MSEKALLEIDDLEVSFSTNDGVLKAVDNVSLWINRGETLGLVGESGCGKSVTSLSVMRLIPNPPGRITGGHISFEGVDLVKAPEQAMRNIRGNRIAMIFQEPMTSLDPVRTAGFQISESLMLHQGLGKREAKEKAVEMLRLVGIPYPERRVDEYSFEMSGGMCQRVMIAMALACNPSLLIADEPTTALDVTVQAQILELLNDLKDRLGMSMLLISHDLGVVAEVAARVAVMYAGQIVEQADTVSLFRNPLHPYTQGLLNSIPKLDGGEGPLYTIEGTVPDLLSPLKGCRFAERCPKATPHCFEEVPPLMQLPDGRMVRCWLPKS